MFPATLTRTNNGHVRRILVIAIVVLLAFTVLTIAPGGTPPAFAAKSGSYTFTFEHTDGTTTTVPSSGMRDFADGWNVFIPDAGGKSATDPTGMTVHMSCSDFFVDGWGQEGGPDPILDSEWRVVSYYIVKAQGDPCGTPPPDVASLTIVKNTVGGDATFQYQTDLLGSFSITTSSSTGSHGFFGLEPGGYTVVEDLTALGADWTFTGLVCEGAEYDVTGAEATVYLLAGDNATCTYTNTYEPPPPPLGSLTIIKKTIGGDGAFEFLSTNPGDFSLATSGGTASTVFSGLEADTYDVAEDLTALGANWAFTSLVCDAVEQDVQDEKATIYLQPGEDVTCTYTNTYTPPPPASLTIVKGTLGGVGEFFFLSEELGGFSLDTTNVNPNSTTFSDLDAGSYTVAEDLDKLGDGWAFIQNSLDCGDVQAEYDRANAQVTVNLNPGDDVTCKFINQHRQAAPPVPSIDIEKGTNGEDADDPSGPEVALGDTVEWTYVITNTGQVDLVDVVVTDDIEGEICTIASLAVGASETCTKEREATETGQYANVGTATAGGYDGTVTDSDPSHYYVAPKVAGTAQLGDTVWLDANDNGKQDSGEKGFNGAKVNLKDADGNVVATLTTATGAWVGFYKFVGLDAGTYTASLDLSSVSGYKVTTAKEFKITLAEGDDFVDADFGLYKAEELPKTGVDSENLALLGLGLLMLGTLAVLSTRRRPGEER